MGLFDFIKKRLPGYNKESGGMDLNINIKMPPVMTVSTLAITTALVYQYTNDAIVTGFILFGSFIMAFILKRMEKLEEE